MAHKYDKKFLERLAKKVVTGNATEEEKIFLQEYYDAFDKQPDISGELSAEQADILSSEIKFALMKHLDGPQKNIVPFRRSIVYRVAIAASVLLFLSIGAYFYLNTTQQQTVWNNDVRPGSNKAILKTGYGKTFILTDAHNGQLAKQGNTAINKIANGQLVYTGGQGTQDEKMIYDTLTIPAAGQFRLKLPDGSMMWLNSLTQVRYPEHFTGNERTVELISGEAYMEVVHNAKMPFKVMVKGQTISDIGTHFNINAYNDEPVIKTSLIEGSISVSKGSEKVILIPGQESILGVVSNSIIVRNGNTEEAIAWKNGYFRFNNENIQGIMRQLSRWYNIDVAYQGSITTDELNGKISRFKNISQVLRMLESTKLVHFKIEGRRVTVIQ